MAKKSLASMWKNGVGTGWFGESARHSLASKGVKTGKQSMSLPILGIDYARNISQTSHWKYKEGSRIKTRVASDGRIEKRVVGHRNYTDATAPKRLQGKRMKGRVHNTDAHGIDHTL
jgi:hypothetical protein